MSEEAKKTGVLLIADSGYRSIAHQKKL